MLSELQPSNPLTRRTVPLRLLSLPIRCLLSLLQKSYNKAIYESSPISVLICLVRETLRFFSHKGCSQVLKRCQISDAVWDGACQIVKLKTSATKFIYTGWVWCQIQCSPSSAIYFITHPPLIYLGITAPKNPFKAHNDSIETRVPT